MTIRTTAQFELREDFFGVPTPAVFESDDVQRPQGAFRPAPWLPIAFTKEDNKRGVEYFVVSVGKPLAMTTDGYLVPAGYRAKLVKAGATNVLTYTATDYAQGVVDLTTGARYAVNGTTNYTALQVARAIVERGLVLEDVVATNPPASDADIEAVVEAFVSLPVGVAAYDFWKWNGVAEENNQWWTNKNLQHAVMFHTFHQMKVPYRAALAVDDDAFDASSLVAVSAASGAGDFPQPGELWDIDGLADLARYSLTTEDVVAIALASKPVAKNTDRTPVSCDTDGVLVREKTSIAAISREGDWYLDAEVGLLFLHADTWATLVTGATTITLSYTAYDNASTGAASEHFIYFDGEMRLGGRLSIDEQSNFVIKGSTGDCLASTDPDLGFVHGTRVEPGPLMTMVKSRWSLAGVSATSKMAGTASKGFTHHITTPDEAIADTLVKLTFRI